MGRRALVAMSVGCARAPIDWRPLVVRVQLLLDQGAHSGKGLTPEETALFFRYQDKAAAEYAVSGIQFQLAAVEGAFLRRQGYSQIPDKFLARNRLNLFVTESLGYDIDRDRTGGCSIGPPYVKTFLGLREAGEGTLLHEYAHHLTGDTKRNPTAAGNLWSDLRNDYWLRRQRAGVPIAGFRQCRDAEFARP